MAERGFGVLGWGLDYSAFAKRSQQVTAVTCQVPELWLAFLRLTTRERERDVIPEAEAANPVARRCWAGLADVPLGNESALTCGYGSGAGGT